MHKKSLDQLVIPENKDDCCQRLQDSIKKTWSQLKEVPTSQKWNDLSFSNDNNDHELQHIKCIWIVEQYEVLKKNGTVMCVC